ncbi:MAG: hypothetical protein ACRD44_05605, partial [Bryobacteraceae bacterium]
SRIALCERLVGKALKGAAASVGPTVDDRAIAERATAPENAGAPHGLPQGRAASRAAPFLLEGFFLQQECVSLRQQAMPVSGSARIASARATGTAHSADRSSVTDPARDRRTRIGHQWFAATGP